jgi:hypothetical protein
MKWKREQKYVCITFLCLIFLEDRKKDAMMRLSLENIYDVGLSTFPFQCSREAIALSKEICNIVFRLRTEVNRRFPTNS